LPVIEIRFIFFLFLPVSVCPKARKRESTKQSIDDIIEKETILRGCSHDTGKRKKSMSDLSGEKDYFRYM